MQVNQCGKSARKRTAVGLKPRMYVLVIATIGYATLDDVTKMSTKSQTSGHEQ